MKRFRILPALWLITCFYSPLAAQQADTTLLSLERIFSTRDFAAKRFGPARWLQEGSAYTTLEPSATPKLGDDIVRYDAQTGQREILVPAQRLVPAGDSVALAIEDYAWSEGARRLLVFTNSQRVWRQNTRGDYWVLDLDAGKLKKLGGDAKPSTLMFAKFSPDGRSVGYVRENNLYVETLDANRITQLSFDGSRTLINGTFDWVYEEEFGLRDGFRWSPDGKWIAYWQLDASGVRDFLMINNTDSLYSYIIPVQYPKAGTTNSACRVGVVSTAGGDTRWIEVPGDPRNHYIARMEWAASSDEIVLQHLNRLQNTNEVMLGDRNTGRVRTILTERDSAWVDVDDDDVQWLDNGKLFVWQSERDGWRHAYLVSRDGQQVRLLTPGSYDLQSIARIDEKGGWLYYIASPENPTRRFLYRVGLKGGGMAERLTPMKLGGSHGYQISPNAKWAFHTYSSFGTPPVTELVNLPAHAVVRELAGNALLRARVQSLRQMPVEFFRVTFADGVALDGWMTKPYNFDPQKRYPVLFYVYGEPASQTVLDRWGSSTQLWHLMLAQQGYLVVSVDNRGTPAPRGRAWRKCVYRQIGVLASQDQAAAARVIRRWPYVDSTRVGIWGWSGGGSMTLNAMFRHPDLYQTGVSVAPVSDERYYDTIYQERYMGLPSDNAEGYKNGSPVTFAEHLQGNLLLVHGTGDDNVHFQNSEAVINALVKANKPFTMMAYPNRSHGIFEGRNTTRHLYELITRYLKTNLPPGPVPR